MPPIRVRLLKSPLGHTTRLQRARSCPQTQSHRPRHVLGTRPIKVWTNNHPGVLLSTCRWPASRTSFKASRENKRRKHPYSKTRLLLQTASCTRRRTLSNSFRVSVKGKRRRVLRSLIVKMLNLHESLAARCQLRAQMRQADISHPSRSNQRRPWPSRNIFSLSSHPNWRMSLYLCPLVAQSMRGRQKSLQPFLRPHPHPPLHPRPC